MCVIPGTDSLLALVVNDIVAPHNPAIFLVALDVYIVNDGNDVTLHIKSRLSNGTGLPYVIHGPTLINGIHIVK
jgi:hypothetical protein